MLALLVYFNLVRAICWYFFQMSSTDVFTCDILLILEVLSMAKFASNHGPQIFVAGHIRHLTSTSRSDVEDLHHKGILYPLLLIEGVWQDNYS